jgi:hypothetical protein
MTETLREKLIRCGWVTSFNADTLVELINKHCADVIRDAADQVAPWQEEPTEDSVGPTIDFGYAWALFSKGVDIRQALTAIADELEVQP